MFVFLALQVHLKVLLLFVAFTGVTCLEELGYAPDFVSFFNLFFRLKTIYFKALGVNLFNGMNSIKRLSNKLYIKSNNSVKRLNLRLN